jgi:hypothetical protein
MLRVNPLAFGKSAAMRCDKLAARCLAFIQIASLSPGINEPAT